MAQREYHRQGARCGAEDGAVAMALWARLDAVLRALFGPEPGETLDLTQDERHAFDERWQAQEAALDRLHAEAELLRRRQGWQGDDVRGYGDGPSDGAA